MRLNSASALLALPLLVVADTPDYQAQFQEYLGQAQGYFDKLASNLPSPNKYDHAAAVEASAGPDNIHTIALHNWKDTLYEPVTAGSTAPQEWWVLMTGGNKTCFGHCDKVEAVFNETARKFATEPDTPHMALLNCDNQPVLCNAWSAPVGSLWIFEMLPEPSPISIFTKRLNLTTVTSDELLQLQKSDYKAVTQEHDGLFHPFNGALAQNGLSIPAGYLLLFVQPENDG
ncbi:hypothetical protein O1611_g10543 [Lasiodiplodia mahajangana]|uniref:Uncharacterized protein n=1 Tax=Lasiodiplodia mahajangana TaxID=1108764 RepID=A0ACC2IWY4_9PEZI|nr:hypothetical protein O1611_g10543 [Lasiodiplodia mahajangana]